MIKSKVRFTVAEKNRVLYPLANSEIIDQLTHNADRSVSNQFPSYILIASNDRVFGQFRPYQTLRECTLNACLCLGYLH